MEGPVATEYTPDTPPCALHFPRIQEKKKLPRHPQQRQNGGKSRKTETHQVDDRTRCWIASHSRSSPSAALQFNHEKLPIGTTSSMYASTYQNLGGYKKTAVARSWTMRGRTSLPGEEKGPRVMEAGVHHGGAVAPQDGDGVRRRTAPGGAHGWPDNFAVSPPLPARKKTSEPI